MQSVYRILTLKEASKCLPSIENQHRLLPELQKMLYTSALRQDVSNRHYLMYSLITTELRTIRANLAGLNTYDMSPRFTPWLATYGWNSNSAVKLRLPP